MPPTYFPLWRCFTGSLALYGTEHPLAWWSSSASVARPKVTHSRAYCLPWGSKTYWRSFPPSSTRESSPLHTWMTSYVILHPSRVAEVISWVQGALAGLGLQLNMSKSHAWCPTLPSLPLLPDNLRDLDFSREGITILGVPVGTDNYVSATLKGKLEAAAQQAATLISLDDAQGALLLLRYCVNTKMGFWARTVPPSQFLPTASSFDTTILNTLSTIIGGPPILETDGSLTTRMATIQLRLPPSLGGLGLRSARTTSHPAWLAAWLAAKGLMTKTIPATAHLFDLEALTSGTAPFTLSETAIHESVLEVSLSATTLSSHNSPPSPVNPDTPTATHTTTGRASRRRPQQPTSSSTASSSVPAALATIFSRHTSKTTTDLLIHTPATNPPHQPPHSVTILNNLEPIPKTQSNLSSIVNAATLTTA